MLNFENADIKELVHFFFLLDASESMRGAPIRALNAAMPAAISALKAKAARNDAIAMLHILSFNGAVSWLCGTTAEKGVSAENIVWTDIGAGGGTNTAAAIRAILPGLSLKCLGHHAYRPIIVLATGGHSDDRAETQRAIQALNERLNGKTINVAISVNGCNTGELNDFASEGFMDYKNSMGEVIRTSGDRLILPVTDMWNLALILGDFVSRNRPAPIPETENDGATLPYFENDGWLP